VGLNSISIPELALFVCLLAATGKRYRQARQVSLITDNFVIHNEVFNIRSTDIHGHLGILFGKPASFGSGVNRAGIWIG
jgi:hypothetical protein